MELYYPPKTQEEGLYGKLIMLVCLLIMATLIFISMVSA